MIYLMSCKLCLTGSSLTVTPGANCNNLPDEWLGRASAINTFGNCIHVFDFQDCKLSNNAPHSLVFQGATTQPENIPHTSFEGTWFNKQARSYKACSSGSGSGGSGADNTQDHLLALVNQVRTQACLGALTFNA
jgi:hypothetical protein